MDTCDSIKLNANGIVFSEMIAKNGSRAEVLNSICQGQTIHLGAVDDAFINFRNGEIWSYVSVWDNAIMVLTDTLVDWQKGKEAHGYIYQMRDIAHGNSRLYCLNSIMREFPQALDNALVLFTYIGPMVPIRISQSVPILGSAWIDNGPENNITFSRYQLSWMKENGSKWNLIEESTSPVEDGILGVWDTSRLAEGKYRLRLKVWVDGDDSDHPTYEYPVYREITLFQNAS